MIDEVAIRPVRARSESAVEESRGDRSGGLNIRTLLLLAVAIVFVSVPAACWYVKTEDRAGIEEKDEQTGKMLENVNDPRHETFRALENAGPGSRR